MPNLWKVACETKAKCTYIKPTSLPGIDKSWVSEGPSIYFAYTSDLDNISNLIFKDLRRHFKDDSFYSYSNFSVRVNCVELVDIPFVIDHV